MPQAASQRRPSVRPSVGRGLCAALFLALLALLAAALGLALRDLIVDDAYITYCYARNLASSGIFRVHPLTPALSTTAPLYALLLALPAWLGLDIPLASNALGAASIWGSSACLYALLAAPLGRRPAALAALLLCSAPLLWLVLGMETPLLLLCICGAFVAASRGQEALAGLLLGLAIGIRADALLPAGLLAAWWLLQHRRLPWRGLLAAAAVVAPLALYLTLAFGSPVPVTLAAKRAQIAIGVTGFGTDTTFAQGLWIMLRGWWRQSPALAAWLPVALLGPPVLLRPIYRPGATVQPGASPASGAQRGRWDPRATLPIVLAGWGLLHAAAYILLRVSPYQWYYVPLAVSGALLAAAALRLLLTRPGRRWRAATLLLTLALLVAQGTALARCVALQRGWGLQAHPAEEKVLPGLQGRGYAAVGRWLRANLPPEASVAVADVGVVGYVSGLRMLDLHGLLEPEVARALARGDRWFTIPHYLPDALVLSSSLQTFGLNFGEDPWFQSTYRTVPVPEGDAVVALRRSPDPGWRSASRSGDLLPGLSLEGGALEAVEPRPGAGLRVRLDLQGSPDAAQPVTLQLRLVDAEGRRVAWQDRTLSAGFWDPQRAVPVYFTLTLPADGAAPLGQGPWTVAVATLQPGQDAAALALAPLEEAEAEAPGDVRAVGEVLGDAIRLDALRGDPLADGVLLLEWSALADGTRDYHVFVHLLCGGALRAQHDGPPAEGRLPTGGWVRGQQVRDVHALPLEGPSCPEPALLVGLYDPLSGERLRTAAGADGVLLPLGEGAGSH
jgi:hypothetical protein